MQRRLVPDLVVGQTLRFLPPGATVAQAVGLMAEHHVGAVLVEEAGRVVGVFTERDLVTRVVARGLLADDTKLTEVMTVAPETARPEDTVGSALERMSRGGYRHLPVVEEEKLVGMVSMRDLFRAVNEQLEEDLKQRDALLFDTGHLPR